MDSAPSQKMLSLCTDVRNRIRLEHIVTYSSKIRLAAATFVLAHTLCASAKVEAQTIAVVTTDSLISTNRTISGVRKAIRNGHPDAGFVRFQISPDSVLHNQQAESISQLDPDVIVTVGSQATEFAKDHFKNKPIVFSSVMYPVISGFVNSVARPGGNVTGASLNIPPDIQFRSFQKIVPSLRRVGVLYSENTAPLIPPSAAIAREMGLELVAMRADDARDLPNALDSLTASCDGIWSLADPNLFSPQSTKFILLKTIRRGIPFMGFSRNVVESGALFALDFDYKAIGRQAGQIVNKILSGTPPDAIPVTTPDIRWFHYNERTSELIGVAIPEDLIAIAKEVYR